MKLKFINSTQRNGQVISTISLSLIIGGMLLITSCQKNELGQPIEEDLTETHVEIPALALEKFILDINFNLPTERLTDQQVQELYENNIQVLSEGDREQLIAVAKQALVQMHTQTTQAVTINPRASESFLTNGSPGDEFGQGVAISGSKVYVGAPGEQKVYEYAKSGGSYTIINEISPTGTSGDFGYAVSVSGSWMVVGAPNFGPPFGQAGRAFLFQKIDGSWVQKDILDGPAGNTNFGESVVLRAKQLAILSRNPGPALETTVSVYRGNGLSWSLTDELSEPGYGFFSIDMNTQGSQIVGTGAYFGSVLSVRAGIFSRGRRSWTFDEAVVDVSGGPFIFFPRDIAIHNNTIVLSTFFPGTDHFVITPTVGGWSARGWTVAAKLTTPPAAPSNRWVDIHGNKIVVGVDAFSNDVSEQIHVFEKAGSSWQLTNSLAPSDGGVDARMWDLALQGDVIVAGLPGLFGAPGKAFVFK